jgi:3-hydroxybutyryl-CoA dehydrogenase
MELRTLGIVGGGSMGKSIAEKVASRGIRVIILERSAERAAEARAELVANLDQELAKWGITQAEKQVTLGRVSFTADAAELAGADLLIEAVHEDLGAKQDVMRRLGAICPADRVFITNTSTLSVTEIAAASGRADRVIGMHFMFPVTRSPIVEVVRGAETSDATYALALEFARVLDKTPITVFESAGYVITRAVLPFVNEAAHIVMEGVASAEDVDKAIRMGFEFKFGPLEYADRVGLDKILGWMELLFRESGDPKYRPCPLLRKLVRAGHLGRKVGRGFFVYRDRQRVEALDGGVKA